MNKQDIGYELHHLGKIIWDIRTADSEFMRGKYWVDLYDHHKKLCDLMNYKKIENGASWHNYEIVLDVDAKNCPYCNADLLVGEKER